eukprot:CAMPEP_0171785634 /NCGR_PEP_ID=MMETSP0991-20121206/62808_1 /TAXON_ID=483369 /ORGANISM="non described non described, Strain CCMP2098" /LENGTH=291 /DNA_ID=CAMNT_0012394205 /DNA_START=56 /DNA_END=929 /DNA_ORIENTATION=-
MEGSQMSSNDNQEIDRKNSDVVGVSDNSEGSGLTRSRLRQLRRNPNSSQSLECISTSSTDGNLPTEHVPSLPAMPPASLLENTLPILTFVFLIIFWLRQEDALAAIFPADFVETIEDMLLMFIYIADCDSVRSQNLSSEADVNHWNEKVRVFIGHITNASTNRGKVLGGEESDNSGGRLSLAQLDVTDHFRDALLLYANDRWIRDDKCLPSQAVTMSLLDFGDVEVQCGNGKTQRQKRRQLLFLPLDDCASADLGNGDAPSENQECFLSCKKRKAALCQESKNNSAWSVVK